MTARDTIGRFAPQLHTGPEVDLDLAEVYLDDTTTAPDFDIHDVYDDLQRIAAADNDAWLGDHLDEYFTGPEPTTPAEASGFDTDHTTPF